MSSALAEKLFPTRAQHKENDMTLPLRIMFRTLATSSEIAVEIRETTLSRQARTMGGSAAAS
jgi:hypothetical protein